MKILYFDTETTGTDSKLHEIIQFAALIEVDGKIVEEVNYHCQPTKWDFIDPEALKTTGLSIEKLKTFQPPSIMFADIKKLLRKYVGKYDKMPQKFYPAGHNIQFDLDFLNAFFKQHGDFDDKQWGITSYQNWRSLDSRVFSNFLCVAGKLSLPNVQLTTLCNHFQVEINAHDALSDIRATREVIKKMTALLS